MVRERTSRPAGWVLARQFADVPQALKAYEAARDLLLNRNLEASAYRVAVDEVSFVALLGERPLGPTDTKRVDHALRFGLEAQLPESVVQELRRRRDDFRKSGAGYVERRRQWP